jgi:hypothetical protein
VVDLNILWVTFLDRVAQVNKIFADLMSDNPDINTYTLPVCKKSEFSEKTITENFLAINLDQISAKNQVSLLVSSTTTAKIIEKTNSLHPLKSLPTYIIGNKTLDFCKKNGFNIAKETAFVNSKEFELHLCEQEENLCTIIYPGAVVKSYNFSSKLKNILHLDLYKTISLEASEINDLVYLNALKDIDTELISVFTSPSCVKAFKDLKLPFGKHQIAIGKTTEASLRSLGLEPYTASNPSYHSIVKKIEQILN